MEVRERCVRTGDTRRTGRLGGGVVGYLGVCVRDRGVGFWRGMEDVTSFLR